MKFKNILKTQIRASLNRYVWHGNRNLAVRSFGQRFTLQDSYYYAKHICSSWHDFAYTLGFTTLGQPEMRSTRTCCFAEGSSTAVGLMDKASFFEAGDSRFQPWAGQHVLAMTWRIFEQQKIARQFLLEIVFAKHMAAA